jgi:hypothetical protein
MQPEMDPVARERERRRQKRQEQIQKRRMALGIGVVALVVLIVVLALALSGGDDTTTTSSSSTTSLPLESSSYAAELTGDQSVPAVKTQAAATFKMEYISSTKELSWSLEITKSLTSPTLAAIYSGKTGTAGSVVYTLYAAGAGEEGAKVGLLADGVINEDDLVGPLKGGTIADLIQLIRDGNAYVSIGNKSHPTDAIRGAVSTSQ